MRLYHSAVITVSIICSGCSAGPLSCSSDDVEQLVFKTATQRYSAAMNDRIIFEVENIRYKLSGITTVFKDGNKIACKAQMDAEIPYRHHDGEKSPLPPDAHLSKTIDYTATLSDDGKQVFVQAQGF